MPRRKRSLPRQSAAASTKEAGPANKRGTSPKPKPTRSAAPPSQPAGDADQQQTQQTEPSRADSGGAHTQEQVSLPNCGRWQSLLGGEAPELPPDAAPATSPEGEAGNRTTTGPAGMLRTAGSVNSAAGGSGGNAGPAASDLHKTVPAAAVAPEQRKVFQLAVGLKAPTNAPTTLAAQGIVPKPKALPSKLKPRPAGPSAADAAASKAVLAKLLRGAAEQQQQADASAAQQPSISAEPAGGSNSADGTHTQQLVSPPAQIGGSLPEWCLREEAYLAGTLLDTLPPQPSSPLASTPTSSRLPIASPFQQQQTQRAAPSRQPSDPRLSASSASPSSVPWRPGGWQQQQQQQQASLGNAGVPYTAAFAAPAVPALKQEAGLPLRNHSLPAPAQPAPVQYPQQRPAAQPGHSTLNPPSWAMQQPWPAGQASGLAVLGRGIPTAAQQPQQQAGGRHECGAGCCGDKDARARCCFCAAHSRSSCGREAGKAARHAPVPPLGEPVMCPAVCPLGHAGWVTVVSYSKEFKPQPCAEHQLVACRRGSISG